jgi:antirestriction protein ArdC
MVKKTTDELDENGEKIIKLIPTLKYYNVFSVEDVEGIEPKHQPDPIVITIPRWHYETEDVEIDESLYNPAAESIIADYIKRAGTLTLDRDGTSNEAYYQPALDHVVTPNITQFSDHAEFYSTLFHELGHSTGHSSRLNRFTGKAANAAFGSQEYSKEELVAEIGAAALVNHVGLETSHSLRNSAAYVQNWLQVLKDDKRFIVSAAGKAEKAVNLILGSAD